MANTAFETEYFSLAACRSDLAMPFPVPAYMQDHACLPAFRIFLCQRFNYYNKIFRTCWNYSNWHFYCLLPICPLKNSVHYLCPKSQREKTKVNLICKIIATGFKFSRIFCNSKNEWSRTCIISCNNKQEIMLMLCISVIPLFQSIGNVLVSSSFFERGSFIKSTMKYACIDLILQLQMLTYILL